MEKSNRCFNTFKGLIRIVFQNKKKILPVQWMKQRPLLFLPHYKWPCKLSACLSECICADRRFQMHCFRRETQAAATRSVRLILCLTTFALPLCCGKFYQWARALSDQLTAMAQHACRIGSRCTRRGAQSDAEPASFYSCNRRCWLAEIPWLLFVLLNEETCKTPSFQSRRCTE